MIRNQANRARVNEVNIEAVISDIKSGRYYVFEICKRHHVSSKTIAKLRKEMK
jgi:hypothetical protein